MKLPDFETFLNSNWAFALTQTGAQRRRFLVILLGASLWALFAFLFTPFPQGWDAGMSQRFLFYILQTLFFSWIFPLILVLAIFFGLVIFLAPRYFPKANPAIFRWFAILLPALFGALWAFMAYTTSPPDWEAGKSAQLLVYPFQALFAPVVLRHVVVAGFAFWAAYRAACYYLVDIYELTDIAVAEGFILQAAFGSGYNILTIKEGAVAPEQRESPIVRIGGPGWLRVQLDNAALLETSEGNARVIGPTGERRHDRVALTAFERLRDVIDLRDLIDDLSIDGRTSDGIRVRAQDVHVVFSVYRGNRASTMEQPYPFDEDALLRLFYRLEKGAVKPAMLNLIRRELGKFITQHVLNEFLSSAGEPDQSGDQPAGGDMPGSPAGFYTRSRIIEDLFTAQFANSARNLGIELKWIGVGSWVPADEIVGQRHRQAWQMRQENRARSSQAELDRLRMEAETQEFLRLVQEVPLLTFRRNADLAPLERMRRLVIAYHGRLNEVYETLVREGRDPEMQQRLNRVLVYLTRFTTRRFRREAAAGTAAGGIPPLDPPPGGPPDAG